MVDPVPGTGTEGAPLVEEIVQPFEEADFDRLPDGISAPLEVGNFSISFSRYEAVDGEERVAAHLLVKNALGGRAGSIEVTKIPSYLEAITLVHALTNHFGGGEGELLVPVEGVCELLALAESSGFVVSSSFGWRSEEIVSGYRSDVSDAHASPAHITIHTYTGDRSEVIDCSKIEEALDAGVPLWIDIDARIADTAWNVDTTTQVIREHAPVLFKDGGAFASGEGSGYLYLDHRIFASNPEDPCQVSGKKLCCFLAPSIIVTVRDGIVSPVNEVRRELEGCLKNGVETSSGGGAYLKLLEASLKIGEGHITRFDQAIESIQAELATSGSLSKKTVGRDIPVLDESFGYITRKLEMVSSNLRTLQDSLESGGLNGLFGSTDEGKVRIRLGQLDRFAKELGDKASARHANLRNLTESHQTLVSMRRESISVRTAMLEALTWPPLIALSTIQVLSVLGDPAPMKILTAGIVTSVALLATAIWKKWG